MQPSFWATFLGQLLLVATLYLHAGMLRQTDKALSTPLPRVFDTDPTTGKPIPSAPAVMGTEQENVEDAVRTGTLNEIADQTGSKMELEVLAPMEQWLRLFQVQPFLKSHSPMRVPQLPRIVDSNCVSESLTRSH